MWEWYFILSGVLLDVVLRESWKLVSHQQVHSVKVDYSQQLHDKTRLKSAQTPLISH